MHGNYGNNNLKLEGVLKLNDNIENINIDSGWGGNSPNEVTANVKFADLFFQPQPYTKYKQTVEEKLGIKDYIIKKDATIIYWEDGDKTVVKMCEGDKYDKRMGFLYAYIQKKSKLSKRKINKFLDNLEEKEQKSKKTKSIKESTEIFDEFLEVFQTKDGE